MHTAIEIMQWVIVAFLSLYSILVIIRFVKEIQRRRGIKREGMNEFRRKHLIQTITMINEIEARGLCTRQEADVQRKIDTMDDIERVAKFLERVALSAEFPE